MFVVVDAVAVAVVVTVVVMAVVVVFEYIGGATKQLLCRREGTSIV